MRRTGSRTIFGAALVLAALLSASTVGWHSDASEGPRTVHAQSAGLAPWEAKGMQVVGQVGGAVGAMAFARDGRMLWLAEGPRLVAVDMSEPASPLRMGRSPVQSGLVGAVAPGTRFVAALVHDSPVTELVLFAAAPSRPEMLGRVRVSASATKVAVLESPSGGDTVIVADDTGLQVIDARNPAEPSHGGAAAILPIESLVAISSAGESLVVLADALWVFTLDAQGRLQPAAEHELRGGRALCSVGWGVVAVSIDEWRIYASFVDLRDPAEPLVRHNWRLPVGRSPAVYQTACSASRLLVSGRAVSSLGPWLPFNLAYGLPSVEAHWEPPVDLSLPDLDLGSMGPAHAALGAASILFAHHRGGVDILVQEASGYELRAPLPQPVGSAGRIAVRGGLAAVSAQDGTVRLLDLRDANAPRLISMVVERPGVCCWPAPALAWRGDVLWVAGTRLRAWDLRLPEAPEPVFDRALEGWGRDLAFVGEQIVVAMGEDGLAIYPSGDPAAPSPPGRWTFPGTRMTSGLAVRGDVLWLTEDSGVGGALRTLRVPGDGPVASLGLLPSPAVADIGLVGDHVALVGAPTGRTTRVVVVDGRDPGFPEALGEIDLPGRDGRFPAGPASPERLLLALHGQGVHALDVRVPAFPDEIAYLRTPGDALDIAVTGDLAWLADGEGGLVAVHVGGAQESRAWLPWVGQR